MVKFQCKCGHTSNVDIELIGKHIMECEQFKSTSPLKNLFDHKKLKESTFEQLTILKADFKLQLQIIDSVLSTKHRYVAPQKKQNSLKKMARFTSNDDDIAEQPQVQKKVRQEHPQDIEPIVESDQEEETIYMPPVRVSKNIADDLCLSCGTDTKLVQNSCYHMLCQDCFVLMYRGNFDLSCMKKSCRKDLTREYILMAARGPSKCNLCDLQVNQTDQYTLHLTTCHPISTLNRFICRVCKAPQETFEKLKVHQEKHHA